jgi:DNA-binding beta-propeller fold protein YncE
VIVLVGLLQLGASADPFEDRVRELIGVGWENAPHGQTLASDVLGQFVNGDPSRPSFGMHGAYGGASDHGFFFFAYGAGRHWTLCGLATSTAAGKLAVPDYWNHRVLLFDLNPDGSLVNRRASALIGQARFDEMEIGCAADRLNYPAACAFDPAGRLLFVADSFNHRVLQFDMRSPRRAVRVYGQSDFEGWGFDAATTPRVVRKANRQDPFLHQPNERGMFFPRGVACDGKRLFVSDYDNQRILVFNIDGSENGPTAIAVLGQNDFTQCKANRGGKAGLDTVNFPSALALDEGARHLIVADSANRRALIFDISGEIKNGMPAVAAASLPPLPQGEHPFGADERWPINGAVSVATGPGSQIFLTDREGYRVLVYDLDAVLGGNQAPRAAIGRFEMMTDLQQAENDNGGPTALAAAGQFLYAAEPRGNRVLCFDSSDPDLRTVNLLGQFDGNDTDRPNYHKYAPNNGPTPSGFDFGDGWPSVSVTYDGEWLMVADSIGGRLLFFPLRNNGTPLDRAARFALGASALDVRMNKTGNDHFKRPGHAVMTDAGDLFVSDFSGSRILHFEMTNLASSTGKRALEPLRDYVKPADRKPHDGESFDFRSNDSGIAASHVLGQVDFDAELRDHASISQLGKQISGLALDRERGWLIVTEMMNHRVVIFDISKGVSNFMPAFAVLGQPDFDQNAVNFGQGTRKNLIWHPQGMWQPHGSVYDHATKRLFVVNGKDQNDREILCYDLSGKITNGMEPAMRIGGAHATVKTDVPVIGDWIGIDEKNRRLWSNLYCLDISDPAKGVPVIGYFGKAKERAEPKPAETTPPPTTRGEREGGNPTKNRLGYSVEACNRFDGAVEGLAVNPQTGTVYASDNSRYRVLVFQPEFQFDAQPLPLKIGQLAVGITGVGGLSPLTFTVVADSVPAGLKLDPATGIITGTPTDKPGEYQVKVTVKTALGERNGSRTLVLVK